MGQCIKCGKETDNQYTYYIGDIVGSYATRSHNSLKTTTEYVNVVPQSEFVCTKCITSNILDHWISYLFGSIVCFAILSILFLYRGPLMDPISFNSGSITVVLLFAVLGIISAIKAIFTYCSVQNDKPVSDCDIDILLIVKGKKPNPKKEYFTPSEYQKLKKKTNLIEIPQDITPAKITPPKSVKVPNQKKYANIPTIIISVIWVFFLIGTPNRYRMPLPAMLFSRVSTILALIGCIMLIRTQKKGIIITFAGGIINVLFGFIFQLFYSGAEGYEHFNTKGFIIYCILIFLPGIVLLPLMFYKKKDNKKINLNKN
jgi:preprotein translocase subunit SecG